MKLNRKLTLAASGLTLAGLALGLPVTADEDKTETLTDTADAVEAVEAELETPDADLTETVEAEVDAATEIPETETSDLVEDADRVEDAVEADSSEVTETVETEVTDEMEEASPVDMMDEVDEVEPTDVMDEMDEMEGEVMEAEPANMADPATLDEVVEESITDEAEVEETEE